MKKFKLVFPFVALSSLASIGVMNAPSFGESAIGHAKLPKPSKAALAFYRGKTLDIIAGSVGGSLDLEARAIAPTLSSYLGVSVDVQDWPGPGGILSQDATEKAVPNGLTIGFVNALGNIQNALTGVSGVNFNPERVAFLSGAGPSGYVVIGSPKSAYTNFAALKSATTSVGVLNYLSGASPTIMQTLAGLMHLDVNYITGYNSSGAVISGFERGDGPVTISTLALAGPLIANGRAVPLAITNKFPVGTNYRKFVLNTPTFAQLVRQYPAETNQGKKQDTALLDMVNETGQPLFTQTRVPATRVSALRDAIEYAFSQQSIKTLLTTEGNNDQYIDPVVAKRDYIKTVNAAKLVSQYLKL